MMGCYPLLYFAKNGTMREYLISVGYRYKNEATEDVRTSNSDVVSDDE